MATKKETPALPTNLDEILVETLPTASFDERLIAVQHELKAPKGQYNSFGKYAYRNAEDILEAVKPLLKKYSLRMTISDTIHSIKTSGMMYVEATVSVTDGHTTARVSAQAGIDPNRKGMDIAQSFGSSSSYARKYALNGMFLIDDTKDADATNTHGKGAPAPAAPVKQQLTDEIIQRMKSAVEFGKEADVRAALGKYAATEAQLKQIFG
jgi:hypothetical protein